jgi:hypothetical protein
VALPLQLVRRERKQQNMADSPFETLSDEQLLTANGGCSPVGSRSLNQWMNRARQLGLRITSTTGGRHAPRSYHYSGRAFDAAGSHAAMRQLYREVSRSRPTELFYDHMGGIKHGRSIGAIGGHRNHIHVAF